MREYPSHSDVRSLIFTIRFNYVITTRKRKEKIKSKIAKGKRLARVWLSLCVFLAFFFLLLLLLPLVGFALSTCKFMVRRIIKCYILKLIWIEMGGCTAILTLIYELCAVCRVTWSSWLDDDGRQAERKSHFSFPRSPYLSVSLSLCCFPISRVHIELKIMPTEDEENSI